MLERLLRHSNAERWMARMLGFMLLIQVVELDVYDRLRDYCEYTKNRKICLKTEHFTQEGKNVGKIAAYLLLATLLFATKPYKAKTSPIDRVSGST
jgi:hypothetical protein